MELSASYYSNYNSEPKRTQLYRDLVINYKMKSSNNLDIELPSEFKDHIIVEDPIDRLRHGLTLYINPEPVLKIISDPILPQTVPLKEAPTGK